MECNKFSVITVKLVMFNASLTELVKKRHKVEIRRMKINSDDESFNFSIKVISFEKKVNLVTKCNNYVKISSKRNKILGKICETKNFCSQLLHKPSVF